MSGEVYTLSCDVSGLLSGTYYYFPLYSQSNPINAQFGVTKNGRNTLTFTMGSYTHESVSFEGRTIYKFFMDDLTRGIATNQGPIQLSHFMLVKGNKASDWSPAPEDYYAIKSTSNSMSLSKNSFYYFIKESTSKASIDTGY